MRRATRAAVRKLGRMRWRVVAISLVVAMAMAMFVSGLYGGAVLDSSVASFFEDSRMPDLFVGLPGHADATAVASALDAADGVGAYSLRLRATGGYSYRNETLPVALVGMGDPARKDICALDLVSGRLFLGPGEAVAVAGLEGKGARAGAALHVRLGGSDLPVNVTGVVRSPEYVFTSAYADMALPTPNTLLVLYMPLADLQAAVGPGINDVIVLLMPGADREAVASALGPFSPDSMVYREAHPSVVFMEMASSKIKNMLPVIGGVFLFIGFVSVFMTMMRLVQTDSRYIGVLMSLGHGRWEVVRSYLAMGFVLALVGALMGSALAFLMTYGIISASIRLYLSLAITFPLDVWPFLAGAVLIASVVLISAAVPVLLLTRSSVRDALEYRPRSRVRTARAGPARLSRLTRMGLRNAARNPWRMAVTVLVVGATIGTAGMWLVLSDSAFGYMTEQIEADTWDLRATFAAPVPSAGVDAAYLGLGPSQASYVIPLTSLTADARVGGVHSGAVVMASDGMARTRHFEAREGRMDFGGAVLSSKLADDLHASVGDTVELRIGPAVASLRVTGIAQEALATALYTEPANLGPLFPSDNCTDALVALAPGAPPAADAAASMRSLPQVAAVRVRSEVVASFESILATARGFFAFFLLISVLITLAVAGSAVIIGTMERDVEFATLDTLGFTRRHTAKAVLAEMVVLGLLSAAVGIPMAYALAWMLAGVMASVLFYFPVVLLAGATATTFAVGLASVLLSSAMPVRYAWGLDTETTLRERTAG